MKKILIPIIAIFLFIPFINVNAQTAGEKITELSTTDNVNIKTDDPDGNVRYVGPNPDNYVMFNDELWRIIGVFDGQLKIIRSESIGSFSYDTSEYDINSGLGINDWTRSDLMRELNEDYLNENLTSNILWYNGSNKTKDGEFDHTKVMKRSAQNLVDTHTWNLGGIVANDYYYNLQEYYASERGNNVMVCTSTSTSYSMYCNDNIERATKWTGKIGLPYYTDFRYTTSGGENITREECLNRHPSYFTYYDDECAFSSWLYNDEQSLIGITPIITDYYGAEVSMFDGYGIFSHASDAQTIHPTVYLKTDIEISSGNGTQTNPYILDYSYSIDVVNGTSNVSTSFKNNEITITANEPEEGKKFDKWEVVEGNVNLESATSTTTKFIMPEENVKLKATYKALPVEYTILEGADQTYILNSNVDIVIKASGDLSKLSKIKVDNNELNSEDYELVSGSTILTLKSSYLNTLSIGNHTIEFLYNDGSVSTTLIVKQNNNETNNTTNTTTPIDNGEVKGATENLTNPKTGDNIMFYISMLVLSAIGLASVGLYIRKRRFN